MIPSVITTEIYGITDITLCFVGLSFVQLLSNFYFVILISATQACTIHSNILINRNTILLFPIYLSHQIMILTLCCWKNIRISQHTLSFIGQMHPFRNIEPSNTHFKLFVRKRKQFQMSFTLGKEN